MTQSLILVAGLPSGGTSTVAGILHHLGVDMGSLTFEATGSRNYLGFECETAKKDIGSLPGDASPEQIESAFRAYLDKRLATASGPCGVKLNLLALLGRCDGLESLPLTVVHVKRNLDDTFVSDIRYTGEDYNRAAWRGVYDLALRQLVRRVPPVCTIQYEDAIAYPYRTVQTLVTALGLTPTQAQTDKAIAFINPKACKVHTYKIAVVTPWSSPFMWRKTAMNIANMIASFHRDGWQARFFMGEGVDPAARHCDMILQALNWGADLICIVGADQIHPEDMLDRLIDRYYETNGGVISALVPFRGYVSWQKMKPFQPMGWRIVSNGHGMLREFRDMEQDPDMFQPINPADGDLQRVDVIGSGVLMFDRDTILALKKPWFYYKTDEDMRRIADMDSKFVWRLRSEVQVQVWVDTTIKVRHLHAFEIDETWQDRFMDWTEPGHTQDETIKHLPASTVTR